MKRTPMRSPARLTGTGFCSACGIVREDYEGIPVTDCICTALVDHSIFCLYVKAVACPIEINECTCEKHGDFACEECDCTCGGVEDPQPECSPSPATTRASTEQP